MLKLAVAVDPEPLKVPEPSDVAPSLKVTVPMGVLELPPVTVAVKVTDAPAPEGFGDELTTVFVLAALTVCVMAGEVLELKFESPLYWAVIGWFAVLRVFVVKVAVVTPPVVEAVPCPTLVPLSR